MNTTEKIDLTPSWPAVLMMMLVVLDNKKVSKEGRKAAIKTLQQMADVAQRFLELHKKGLPAAVNIRKQDLGRYGENYQVILHFEDDAQRVIKINEDQYLSNFVKLFSQEPIRSGQFNKDELFIH